MAAGVYVIRNIENGKCYYGSTSDLDRRLHQHWTALNNGKHFNEHLMYAWRKYGEQAFRFEAYKVLDSVEEARELEQWILEAHYDRWDQLYNIQLSVDNKVIPEEQKRKISAALKGRPTGRIMSEEHKQKLIEMKTGVPRSEETKRKISESLQGNIPWNKGVAMSEEQKQKISNSKKGIKQSEDRKKNTSEVMKQWWAARKAAQQSSE